MQRVRKAEQLKEQHPLMDADRKYSSRGYQDSGRNDRRNDNGGGNGDRPKPQGPRPPLDLTGPRLPRLVQNVTASRCFSCSTMLGPDIDFTGTCPKCAAQLHCCKQCSYFEPSTRFQCLKPVPVRIAVKDQKNDCQLFAPRVTVARDTISGNSNGRSTIASINDAPPRNASDAKSAFERLFKK